jgi:hypothetical protein
VAFENVTDRIRSEQALRAGICHFPVGSLWPRCYLE